MLATITHKETTIVHIECTHNKKAYCRPCRAAYGDFSVRKLKLCPDILSKYSKGAFVIGTANLKRDVLPGHDISEGLTHTGCGITEGNTCFLDI